MTRKTLPIQATVAVLLANVLGPIAPLQAQPVSADNQKTLYWYCPKCGFETPFPAWQKKRTMPCPNCGKDGQLLEVSNYSHHPFEEPPAAGTRLMVLAAVPIILAGGGALYLLRRGRRRVTPQSQHP
jgi:hypothetical protein